jgi:hypothetical protein
MGCIDVCNEYIAVDECIELRGIDVKRKTTYEWKNRQQFFPPPLALPFRFATLNHPSTPRTQFLHASAALSLTKSCSIPASHCSIQLSRCGRRNRSIDMREGRMNTGDFGVRIGSRGERISTQSR